MRKIVTVNDVQYNVPSGLEPGHCHRYWAERMRALPPERVRQLVGFLRSALAPPLQKDLRTSIMEDREWWWLSEHEVWARKLQQFLMAYAYTEDWLGIPTSFDDYWAGFVELAMMGDNWYDDVPIES